MGGRSSAKGHSRLRVGGRRRRVVGLLEVAPRLLRPICHASKLVSKARRALDRLRSIALRRPMTAFAASSKQSLTDGHLPKLVDSQSRVASPRRPGSMGRQGVARHLAGAVVAVQPALAR